jgi:hypothetical protein
MSDEDGEPTLDINYIKSPNFREVACDGLLGGPTPKGKLWLAFFTERLPLPRIVRHALAPANEPDELVLDQSKPGTLIDGRTGLIRNVEFGLYMSLATARELQEWLGRQIEAIEKSSLGGES